MNLTNLQINSIYSIMTLPNFILAIVGGMYMLIYKNFLNLFENNLIFFNRIVDNYGANKLLDYVNKILVLG